MADLRLEIGSANYLRAASSYVRMQVFILERNLSLADEFDRNDTLATIYSVLFDGSRPVATARLLTEAKDVARIGRVATIAEYRGNHLGSQVVKALEKAAKQKRYNQILIHGDLSAAAFYESLVYLKRGEPYEEDGVSCITLVKMI